MVRAQVTNANFVDMVKKYSTDPGAAQNNGQSRRVREAGDGCGVLERNGRTQAGEISQPVESQFGFHIIQRLPYAEVKNDFAAKYAQAATRIASTARTSRRPRPTAKIQVKDNAAATMKAVAKEANKHRTDKTTLATFNGGELTVADFLSWIETAPPQQQIMQRIPQAPDSVLKPFVKQIAVQQVLLKRANDAKVDITPKERETMYAEIGQLVTNVWGALGIDPKMLADSAKSTGGKGAARRVARRRVPRPNDGGTGADDLGAVAAQEDARHQVRVVGEPAGHRPRVRARAAGPRVRGLGTCREPAEVAGSDSGCRCAAGRCSRPRHSRRPAADRSAAGEEAVARFTPEGQGRTPGPRSWVLSRYARISS